MNRLPSTLDEWLYYFEHRHDDPIQLGLERVRKVADLLDLLSTDSVVITVAGTNGKGSTVAALDQIYHSAGYCVARYTSPHLIRFNERICIQQQEVSDEDLCQAFSTIHQLPESLLLTYFEITTLAALFIFKKCQPDVIILEVGMGGRLDATNIVEPDLSIITTIDLDHQAWLGYTREEIAQEKAGILRHDKPAIYADFEAPLAIINRAEQLNSSLLLLNQDYHFQENEKTFSLQFLGQSYQYPKPKIHLHAAAAALVATFQLQDQLGLTEQNRIEAMKQVRIPCRLMRCAWTVPTLFDVAHNPQSVQLLVNYLSQNEKTGKIYAVFSGLKDKDLLGLIKPMREIVDVWYPALLTSPRAAQKFDLQQAFARAEINISGVFKDPIAAYQAAEQALKGNDLIVVYGSFLTVGAVYASYNRCGGTYETNETTT